MLHILLVYKNNWLIRVIDIKSFVFGEEEIESLRKAAEEV